LRPTHYFALKINSSDIAETTTVNNFNYCSSKISRYYQDQDNNTLRINYYLTLALMATTAVPQKLHQRHQPHTWATQAFQIIYFDNWHWQQHQQWCRH
jgi:hypothetical protein